MSARGAHRSKTALGPRPGVLTLQPVAATPELRTERSSCSSRLEESGLLAAGQTGARGEGLRVELHLLVSVLLPGLGYFSVGTDPVSSFPSLRTGPGSSGVPVPTPSHLWPLMPVHSHLQPLTPGNSHLQLLTPAHSLQGRWGWEGHLSASGLLAGISLFYISLKCLT